MAFQRLCLWTPSGPEALNPLTLGLRLAGEELLAKAANPRRSQTWTKEVQELSSWWGFRGQRPLISYGAKPHDIAAPGMV